MTPNKFTKTGTSFLAAAALMLSACGGGGDAKLNDELRASVGDEVADCLDSKLSAEAIADANSGNAEASSPEIEEEVLNAFVECEGGVGVSVDDVTDEDGATAETQQPDVEEDAAEEPAAEETVEEEPVDDSNSGAGGIASFETDPTYGSDAVLDALWDECEATGTDACDDLFFQSEFGSGYEAFGELCGGRFEPGSQPAFCGGPVEDTGPAVNYGDDTVLDAMYDACTGGDGAACDDLYWQSPLESEYEIYGRTCGARFTEVDAPISCAEEVLAP